MSGTSKSNVSDTSTLFFPDLLSAQNRVLLKAGPRPSSPRPATRSPRWPSPDFPQFFCPVVNPRASTDLHWVWVRKTDDSKFEFVYHFNHLNPCVVNGS